MTRSEWLKKELAFMKAGQAMEIRCVMATPERLALDLCGGKVPEERMRRGTHTCSPECQSDYRRLRREELRKGKCLSCGHNLPKKEREKRLLDAQNQVLKGEIPRQNAAESLPAAPEQPKSYGFIGKPLDSECFYGYHNQCRGCNCKCHPDAAKYKPVAPMEGQSNGS